MAIPRGWRGFLTTLKIWALAPKLKECTLSAAIDRVDLGRELSVAYMDTACARHSRGALQRAFRHLNLIDESAGTDVALVVECVDSGRRNSLQRGIGCSGAFAGNRAVRSCFFFCCLHN